MGFFRRSPPKRSVTHRTAPKTVPSSPFKAECERAMAELELRTSAHVRAWHMDECEWAVRQDTGLITFTDRKRGMVANAPVQFIGTFNTEDSSWLWAWANPSLQPALVADAEKLRAYGTEKQYPTLIAAKVKCEEKAAWKLAALACIVGGQEGAYRGPAGTTMVFMTFGPVELMRLAKG